MSKYSEMPIRQEKVNRLKAKIAKEIEDTQTKYQSRIKPECLSYNDLISDYFTLIMLSKYINFDNAFMQIEKIDKEKDIIIYAISDNHIDMFLRDDYNVALNFIVKADHNGYDIFPMLNDSFFEHQLVSIVDDIIYGC